jgi:predicted nucleic acid-binding protein
MAVLPFLDTNLFLRHLTNDNPDLSPRATALWRRIAADLEVVETADTVVFEAVFTLQSFYRLSRVSIRDGVLPLLLLRSVRLANKRRYQRAFDLYITMPGLSFADCFHVALMESRGLTHMISFDHGLGRVPTMTRVEPDAAGELHEPP